VKLLKVHSFAGQFLHCCQGLYFSPRVEATPLIFSRPKCNFYWGTPRDASFGHNWTFF